MPIRKPLAYENGALTAALVNRIQEMIHGNELAIGEKLPPERQLVQMLGVSRSSVRQAVKSLESMGIVVSRVGVGNFINPDLSTQSLLQSPMRFVLRLNHASRRELYEMRQVVETYTVGLTAERATDRDLETLKTILQEMADHADDSRALAECDHHFHMAILNACGNSVFRMIFEPISTLLWEDLEDRMHLFDPEETLRAHRAIYEAIRSGDKELAIREMKCHLERGYETYFGGMDQALSGTALGSPLKTQIRKEEKR